MFMDRSIVRTTVLTLIGLGVIGLIPWQSPHSQAQAHELGEYYRASHDQSIVQALMVLEQTTANASVDEILDKQVRIVYKNMATIGKQFRNDDALSWLMEDGSQLIFINEKHQYAPPQALAAIISHEIMHNDEQNSLNEEVHGWQRELKTWKEVSAMYPELKTIPVGSIPLVDRLNALAVLEQQKKLVSTIREHPAYQGLPEHSRGF